MKPKDIVGSLVVVGFMVMIGWCVYTRVTPNSNLKDIIPTELIALAGPIITNVVKDKILLKNGGIK